MSQNKFNYRNKLTKSGLYSIHLRVTIDQIRRYYEIKVPEKVKLDQWAGRQEAWVKEAHQGSTIFISRSL